MPLTETTQARQSGRPPVAERRDCVVGVRLTQAEFEGLNVLLTNPRASLSDLCRELLSEAVLERMRRGQAQA